jgi:hypothetical protein
VQLCLVHPLTAACDPIKRIVQQAQRFRGPAGERLGLSKQTKSPCDKVLSAARLDSVQAPA